MSEHTDAKNIFRDARNAGSPDNWTPLPANEFAAELARSHPNYVVRSLLGFGGMGAVYAAEQVVSAQIAPAPTIPKEVAIKMLRQDALDDQSYLRRFDHEISCLQKLRHPHIVRIMESGQTQDGYRFFVMERLRGQTLAQELARNGRGNIERMVRLIVQICHAVQYAHEQRLIHRDLKAGNIFITAADDCAVLLDFGVAKDNSVQAGTVSRLQGAMGTPGHIAPELRHEHPSEANEQSDVFSLGVVFFQMLMGQIPDVGHAWPSEVGLDRRWDAVLRKALSQNPQGRFRSASEFASAIQSVVDTQRVNEEPDLSNASKSNATENESTPPVSGSSPNQHTPSPPNNTIRELTDTPASRLLLHREFLKKWCKDEPQLRHTAPDVSAAEIWEVVAQWNAFPEVPPFEVIQTRLAHQGKLGSIGGVVGFALALLIASALALNGTFGWWGWVLTVFVGGFFLSLLGAKAGDAVAAYRNQPDPTWNYHPGVAGLSHFREPHAFDPHQIFWHPNQPHLYVTRDHFHITGWEWRHRQAETGDDQPEPKLISGDQALFDVGSVKRAMFSEHHFMVNGEAFGWWNTGYPTCQWTVYDEAGYVRGRLLLHSDMSFLGRTRGNPWRPRSWGQILLIPDYLSDMVGVGDVRDLPALQRLRGHEMQELLKPARTKLSLRKLKLSDRDTIQSFAWHPSGLYLALALAGRIHLIHWDTGELVGMHLPPAGKQFAAVGWREDGRLLALDEQVELVWDVHTDVVRPVAPVERWRLIEDGPMETKLISCDGKRQIKDSGFRNLSTNFPVDLHEVTDVAWSPKDPNMFATVGGANCPRDIRIWRRKQ